MIKIIKARYESRKRDGKRDRFLLQIGNSRSIHMTFKEIEKLSDKLNTLIDLEIDREIMEG